MAQEKFDITRLDRHQYDWDDALEFARSQRTVEDFMKLVDNEVTYPDDQELLDEFCKLVNDAKVWPLAQMVVTEFRSAKEDQ